MKKIFSIIITIIIYFVLYFLQINFFNWFTIYGVKPNLFILLILFTGLYMNKKVGSILGLLLGIYTDLIFSNTLGISGILFAIVGLLGEFFDKKFSKDSKITMVIIGSLVTALYEILIYIYRIILLSSNIEPLKFIKILLIEILYNALILIIFYPIINNFGRYIESIFNKKTTLPRYF